MLVHDISYNDAASATAKSNDCCVLNCWVTFSQRVYHTTYAVQATGRVCPKR